MEKANLKELWSLVKEAARQKQTRREEPRGVNIQVALSSLPLVSGWYYHWPTMTDGQRANEILDAVHTGNPAEYRAGREVGLEA